MLIASFSFCSALLSDHHSPSSTSSSVFLFHFLLLAVFLRLFLCGHETTAPFLKFSVSIDRAYLKLSDMPGIEYCFISFPAPSALWYIWAHVHLFFPRKERRSGKNLRVLFCECVCISGCVCVWNINRQREREREEKGAIAMESAIYICIHTYTHM